MLFPFVLNYDFNDFGMGYDSDYDFGMGYDSDYDFEMGYDSDYDLDYDW
jgi:hypothetical protein